MPKLRLRLPHSRLDKKHLQSLEPPTFDLPLDQPLHHIANRAPIQLSPVLVECLNCQLHSLVKINSDIPEMIERCFTTSVDYVINFAGSRSENMTCGAFGEGVEGFDVVEAEGYVCVGNMVGWGPFPI